MIELDDISRVGFGAYRISGRIKENHVALTDALKFGCNLIDSASNYTDGESEKLIGKVLSENLNKDVFVITKAGYLSGKNLINFKKLNRRGLGLSGQVKISKGFIHSTHPEYLQEQITISLKRLKRKHLDGFLLHSPEYFFDGTGEMNSDDEYYARIRLAFEFLEEKVKEGTIRYYGVSSNSFFNRQIKKFTDLEKLVELSKEVASDHHFKLVQFPFNICEQGASQPLSENGLSLIEIAQQHNLITFGNRPFNANSEGGLLKLALHFPELNDEANIALYSECLDLIRIKLKEKFGDEDVSSINVIAYLDQNWRSIDREDVFKKVFDGMLFPFISFIYDNNIPDNHLNLFRELENTAWKYHIREVSMKTINYLQEKRLGHFLTDKKPLTCTLIENYLESGIDHVLTGMKHHAYVNEFRPYFTP